MGGLLSLLKDDDGLVIKMMTDGLCIAEYDGLMMD